MFSGFPDPNPDPLVRDKDPDPLVRGTDPRIRIRIRIRTKNFMDPQHFLLERLATSNLNRRWIEIWDVSNCFSEDDTSYLYVGVHDVAGVVIVLGSRYVLTGHHLHYQGHCREPNRKSFILISHYFFMYRMYFWMDINSSVYKRLKPVSCIPYRTHRLNMEFLNIYSRA